MRVFVLGASGTIGTPIVDELIRHDHHVVALARSDATERTLRNQKADVVRGDLRTPHEWAHIVREVDAVIHVAATFSDDMGEVDRKLVEALLGEAEQADRTIRFVYTGGCWLFGETNDRVADETSPFHPIPPFAWMVDNASLVLAAPNVEAMIVHPAMVYSREGGVLTRFITSAEDKGRVDVWGSPDTRWPVVHRTDLAAAYRLVLERGAASQSYCVAAERGVRVGGIAHALTQRFGLAEAPLVRPRAEVIAEQGAWAAGPMLDQQMSGQKTMDAFGWTPAYTDVLAEIR